MLLTMIIYFVSILLPGWLILTIWFDDVTKGFFKKMALAYGLGTVLMTTEIFLIIFILRWPIKWLYPILGAEIVVGGWQHWRRFGFDFLKRLKTESKKITWTETILAVLVTWQIITVGISAWLEPVLNWDSLAMWSIKAKTLFYYPRDFFTPARDSQDKTRYLWFLVSNHL